ncbi:unnamed protein product [Clavelina lepadiformis]|uniref:Uncharacterized protein n=1 Tax=Clavelina lepadiformis TaxID=159417 RepID=A0ABP0EWP2_CLALP
MDIVLTRICKKTTDPRITHNSFSATCVAPPHENLLKVEDAKLCKSCKSGLVDDHARSGCRLGNCPHV